MSAEEDLSLEAKAREWLDMAQTKWRLQTMQHRSRYNPKTGEYRQLPTRVRRFLNGTPVSMKARVLEILKESAPYSCPVFDLETGDAKYVPTNTYIRKDGPELTSGGADATYTIVQDLKLLDEAGDTFGMRDESSCAQVGEAEWHWDEPDVANCPLGGQGVSYQVANVSRDSETDLFSYVIRKVQALTVPVQPVVTSCTERSRVTVESWDNVYGEPGAFRWDPVRGGSARLDVPAACDRSDGTLVKVSVTRNADCTYRVEVERTEAVRGVGMYYSQHDRYKSETGERMLNESAPLPRQGVEYDYGRVTRYQSERNEDGTWTNDVNTTLERPVPGSTVEERRTPRGVARTRVDTNVPDPASELLPGVRYGLWKSTKTPGGLYTNEYVSYARTQADGLGLLCTDTVFLKTHETQGSAASVPQSGHVPYARAGRVTTWNYDTDSEGFVTKRVRTEQEHTVENAVRRRAWGWLGNTSGYTHRSVTSAVASALLASGSAGTSVEARMTNGGLFDVEVQTFLRVAGLRLGLDCQKTVYQHVHETAESAAAIGEEAQDAGGGRTYRRSYALDTATGAITKRETLTTELEVPESRRSVRVTPRGTTVRTTRSNAPSAPADASEPGHSTEFEVTPGGRFNVTVESTVPRAGDLESGCSTDAFEEVDTHSSTSESAGPAHVAGGSGGVYRESVSRLGEDGLWENRSVVHGERLNVDDGVDVVVTARGTRRTVKTRNAPSYPGNPGVGGAVRSKRTRGGLYDVEVTTTSPRAGTVGSSCLRDRFVHSDTSVSVASSASSSHVSGGTGGTYRERRRRLGDDGLWEVEDTTHQEREVSGGLVVEVTSRGKRRTTITRQTSSEGTEPGASDVGKALRRTVTRGGLFDLEETTVEPNPKEVSLDCSRDLFSHVHAKGSTKKDKLSGDVQATTNGSGVYRDRRQRLGDDGLWSVEETEHNELPVTSQRTEVRVTRLARVKRTTDMQVDESGSDPGATAEDVGKERVVEKTRGGKRNITTVVEVTPVSGKVQEECSKDAFLHTHVTVKSVKANSLNGSHVEAAANGKYKEKSYTLNDVGAWEERVTEHNEIRETPYVANYEDAFGTRVVKHFVNDSDHHGDKSFRVEDLITSVEQEMTRGKQYSARVTDEKPKPVDSDWLHFEKVTDKGLGLYYDFIVFRNQKISKVKEWIRKIERIRYSGGTGSYANHPSINVSPNRFGLWDGSVALTTSFTPVAWSSGGNTRDQNWDQPGIEVLSVNFVPVGGGKLLKLVTKETHRRGGGVGKDRMRSLLGQGPMIKGSQFSYHPSGQAFSYDIITAVETKAKVIDMPGSAAAGLWDGTAAP